MTKLEEMKAFFLLDGASYQRAIHHCECARCTTKCTDQVLALIAEADQLASQADSLAQTVVLLKSEIDRLKKI